MKTYKPIIIRSLSVVAFCLTVGQVYSQQSALTRKYDTAELQEDFRIFRGILEQYHPGIYWFSSREQMDGYFAWGASKITDSLSEVAFRNILTYIVSQLRCGHTSVLPSKKFSRGMEQVRQKAFPLSLKVWPDSMAVTGQLSVAQDTFPKGTVITHINGWSTRQFTDTFFQHITCDGWSLNGKYQALSNRGSFGSMYRNLLGLPDTFTIQYKDAQGNPGTKTIPVYDPAMDSARGQRPATPNRRSGLSNARNLQIDRSLSSAYLTLNTFNRGNQLRGFFRKSFREIHRQGIRHLVVDVRANGGGDAGLSTLLTRYLTHDKFRIADSLYAVRKSGDYNRYIGYHFFFRSALALVTRRGPEGYYHFRHFEKQEFRPKKNRFDGNVYLITGGNSYSATVLLVKALQGQPHILVVGEETGGGAYGNSAWMIPQVTLPYTRIRFRLPLFRLVMPGADTTGGRGILPDIPVGATAETIRRNLDPKAEKVRELILSRKSMGK